MSRDAYLAGLSQTPAQDRPRSCIIKGGSNQAQPFAASLTEAATPIVKERKRSANDAAHVRQRMLEEAYEEGFAAGREAGFPVGQKAGYQAGYDQAYAESSNQHGEALRAFSAELAHIRDQIDHAIEAWFAASEREVEAIAVALAQQLVGAQLTLDRTFIVDTTKAALRQIADVGQARIRVNPFDSVILCNSREELLAATASLRGVEIVDDASITAGCMIETDRGAVDATLDTRLEIVQCALEEAA